MYKFRKCGEQDANIEPAYVDHLLSSLVGPWLLGKTHVNVVTESQQETVVSHWHEDMKDRFSKKYLGQLAKENIELIHALHYNLSLALFDHVKVEILKSGQNEAIQNLCVRCSLTDQCPTWSILTMPISFQEVWKPAVVEQDARVRD